MAQFLRPDSQTINTGTFTNTFANIDEAVASDADFMYSTTGVLANITYDFTAPLGSIQSGTCTARFRLAKTNIGTVDGTGNVVTVTPRVHDGTAGNIVVGTGLSITGTWTEYTLTFARSLIQDPSTLRLTLDVVTNTGGNASNRRGMGVSFAEIELPDPIAYTLTGTLTTYTTTLRNTNLLRALITAGVLTTYTTTLNNAGLGKGYKIAAGFVSYNVDASAVVSMFASVVKTPQHLITSSATASSANSATATFPNALPGQLAIVYITYNPFVSTLDAISGWTHVSGSPVLQNTGAALTSTALAAVYKVLDQNDIVNGMTFTMTGAANYNIRASIVLAEFDESSPIISATGNGTNAATTLTWPAITPSSTSDLLFYAVATATDTTTTQLSAPSFTGATTATELIDVGSITGDGGTIGVVRAVPTVTTSVTGTSTMATSGASYAAIAISVKPKRITGRYLNVGDAFNRKDVHTFALSGSISRIISMGSTHMAIPSTGNSYEYSNNDGETWASSSVSTYKPNYAAYNGSIYVISTTNVSFYYTTSTLGTALTQRTNPGWPSTPTAVGFALGYFFVGGSSFLWKSANGVSWSEVTDVFVAGSGAVSLITQLNGECFITLSNGHIVKSGNTVDWAWVSKTIPDPNTVVRLSYLNGQYVASKNSSTSLVNISYGEDEWVSDAIGASARYSSLPANNYTIAGVVDVVGSKVVASLYRGIMCVSAPAVMSNSNSAFHYSPYELLGQQVDGAYYSPNGYMLVSSRNAGSTQSTISKYDMTMLGRFVTVQGSNAKLVKRTLQTADRNIETFDTHITVPTSVLNNIADNSITNANGVLFKVQTDTPTSTYFVSYDEGTTWTQQTWPSSRYWDVVRWFSGKFVATSSAAVSGGGNQIHTSATGLTGSWTASPQIAYANDTGRPQLRNDLVFSMSVGNTSNNAYALQYSYDLVTWYITSISRITSIIWDGTQLVGTAHLRNALFRSTDSSYQTYEQVGSSSTSSSTATVNYSVRKFGSSYFNCQSAGIKTSTNLSTWTDVSGAAGGFTGYDIAFNGTTYVYTNSDGSFRAWYGTVPGTWTTSTANDQNMQVVEWFGGSINKFIGLGVTNSIYSSSDGAAWAKVTYALKYNGLAWDGTTIAAVSVGQISYSTNGTSWTDVAITNMTFNDVCFANSIFVAVGANSSNVGIIYTSTNGIAWTSRTVPSEVSAGTFLKVVYAGTEFVAYTNGFGIVKSSDGISWTTVASRSPVVLQVVVSSGGSKTSSNVFFKFNSSTTAVRYDLNMKNPTFITTPSTLFSIIHSRGDTLYGRTSGTSFYTSTDQGATWNLETTTFTPALADYTIANSATSNSQFVLLTTPGFVAYSNDFINWRTFNGGKYEGSEIPNTIAITDTYAYIGYASGRIDRRKVESKYVATVTTYNTLTAVGVFMKAFAESTSYDDLYAESWVDDEYTEVSYRNNAALNALAIKTGTATSTSTAASTLTGIYPSFGTGAATSTGSSQFRGTSNQAGSATAIASAIASMLGVSAVLGSSSAFGIAASTLTGYYPGVGNSAGVAAAASQFRGSSVQTGTAAAAANTNTVLAATARQTSTVTGLSTAAFSVLGGALFAANSTATSTAAVGTKMFGTFLGASTGATISVSTLRADARQAATVASTATVTAAFRGDARQAIASAGSSTATAPFKGFAFYQGASVANSTSLASLLWIANHVGASGSASTAVGSFAATSRHTFSSSALATISSALRGTASFNSASAATSFATLSLIWFARHTGAGSGLSFANSILAGTARQTATATATSAVNYSFQWLGKQTAYSTGTSATSTNLRGTARQTATSAGYAVFNGTWTAYSYLTVNANGLTSTYGRLGAITAILANSANTATGTGNVSAVARYIAASAGVTASTIAMSANSKGFAYTPMLINVTTNTLGTYISYNGTGVATPAVIAVIDGESIGRVTDVGEVEAINIDTYNGLIYATAGAKAVPGQANVFVPFGYVYGVSTTNIIPQVTIPGYSDIKIVSIKTQGTKQSAVIDPTIKQIIVPDAKPPKTSVV